MIGLFESLLHDGSAHAFDLDVHLDSGDAVFGSGNLEIHIAEVVFVSQNVRENRETIAFFDEAHRDTRDWLHEGSSCIHQGHRSCAHRAHRRRTVRLEGFAHDPDGVRELVVPGHHRMDRAFGKGAVTDLTTGLAAETTGFTDAVRREVVVEHELAHGILVHAVDDLLVVSGSESGHRKDLGLTAGEECRSVGFRQDAGFHGDRTDGLGVTTVDPDLLGEDHFAHEVVLEEFHQALHFFFFRVSGLRIALFQTGGNQGFESGFLGVFDHGVAGLLFLGAEGLVERIFRDVLDLLHEVGRGGERSEFALGLTGFGPELFDESADLLHFFVTLEDRIETDRFRNFLGAAFDHHDRVLGSGDHDLKLGFGLALVPGGVHHELAVDAAHADCGGRSVEGDVGDVKCCTGTDRSGHFCVGFEVNREYGRDDLGVVVVAFREKRTVRAVDQTSGQSRLGRRTAFALQKAPGDFSGSIETLSEFHGEWHEIDSGFRIFVGNSSHEDACVTVVDENGGIGLFGHAAGFECEGLAPEIHRDSLNIHHSVIDLSWVWMNGWTPAFPASPSRSVQETGVNPF